MDFTLKLNMDNAAFYDDLPSELTRVLHGIAEDALYGDVGTVLDSNGNTVGRWEITDD